MATEENMFDVGKPVQLLPHTTRSNAKSLLLYNLNLYADCNVKIGRNGTHYFKCVEAIKGCPGTAHTKVM